ncbi:MAG: hypothetical protein GEU73_01890 [Chloroflexi bacterium]|nr:hypothetical protein [Chloroflexota bacterium]
MTDQPEDSSNGAPQYWLRVHGYPGDLTDEVVYYNEFYDPYIGRLPGDPKRNIHVGDVLIYFADGPASVYGVATVVGTPEGPFPDRRRGKIWRIPIKREAIIRAVNKAPHAAALQPPSGWQFLHVVRDYTYIRLPDEDGPYLVEQVRARAGARE